MRGWFDAASTEEKERLFSYVGRPIESEVHWEVIRLAQMSGARTAMIPLQDLLGGGADTRMNNPGEAEGNWQWRLSPAAELSGVASRLAEMTLRYQRAR